MFGTSMQSLLCGISSAALSTALLPTVWWHISVASLCTAWQTSCKASAMTCAFPGQDVHPGPYQQRSSPGILDQKFHVKSLCYLLFSVVFAAEWILYLFFPLGVLHFDALTHSSPCWGQWSCSSCLASLWAGNLLLLVPTPGFCWGLQPCVEKRFEGEGALSLGLLCFLEQKFHWELANVGRYPTLMRLCPWFCSDMGLMAVFAVTDVLFLKKHVWRGVRNFKYNFL